MYTRDVISVFSRGGHIFDRLPRGGGIKYEKYNILWAKTQKSLFSKIRGANAPPAPP